RPFTREEVWARILRYAGHWSLSGYGFWLVEDKASGLYVGDVGVADFKRDMEPALTAPEAGWVLAGWSDGRGYATEAVTAALAWCEAAIGLTEASCIIAASNLPSLAVAMRCGFKPAGEAMHGSNRVTVHHWRGTAHR